MLTTQELEEAYKISMKKMIQKFQIKGLWIEASRREGRDKEEEQRGIEINRNENLT